jgi:predicted aldo/keto reductase-like oxidoreductase
VNRLGFAGMRLLSQQSFGGLARDHGRSRAVLRHALKLGVNHIEALWLLGLVTVSALRGDRDQAEGPL